MPANTRQCQPCTACCDGWVRMVIEGVEVYPGRPCPHSTGSGCNAYDSRPVDPCINFECGWKKENSPLPDWMRPDEARMMFLPAMRSWQGAPVDVAVPVGKRIPPRTLNWLKDFALKQSRPLIYLEQVLDENGFQKQSQVVAFGPPAFQQEIARLQEAGEKIW